MKPTPGLEPGTPSLRVTAEGGTRVQKRAGEGTKVLLVARIAVDYLGRPRTVEVKSDVRGEYAGDPDDEDDLAEIDDGRRSKRRPSREFKRRPPGGAGDEPSS